MVGLTINCTVEERERIKTLAKKNRQSIRNFLLSCSIGNDNFSIDQPIICANCGKEHIIRYKSGSSFCKECFNRLKSIKRRFKKN